MGFHTRLRPFLLLTLLIIISLFAGTVAADGKGIITQPPLVTPYVDIATAGPLEHIFIGDDVSAQIAYTGDLDYQVYPPATIPGDYGTFLVAGGTLYAPDFQNHGGTATGGLGSYTPFTPVSQSPVVGSGTPADPYRVTTVVTAGGTGLQITQTDSYVTGEESYRTDMVISNAAGTAPQTILLYRAMDCYLGQSDSGYGYVDAATGAVACSENANNTPPGRIEQLLPLTGGSTYYEAGYSDVWSWISTQQPFPNTCECDSLIDNGAGLSWSLTIPAGGSVEVTHLTTFSPLGQLPLTTSKTADAPTSQPGAMNGYTITVTNANPEDVTLDTITDLLPAGFAYVPGSTTGVTSNDPAVSGQALTWSGPFNVPGGGNVTLHFGVTVATNAGTYFNEAGATAAGYTVAPTGSTAPITVEGATSVSLSGIGGDTGGFGTLGALGAIAFLALLTAVGTLVFRRRT